jgi:hypothetical protein
LYGVRGDFYARPGPVTIRALVALRIRQLQK